MKARLLKRLRVAAQHHLFLTAIYTVGGVVFLGAGLGLITLAVIPAPSITSFAERQVDQSTKLYDRTGQVLLYDYNRDVRRQVIPLGSISSNAIHATLAIEDDHFYTHGGIRITALMRALIRDIMGGSLAQGGSTITQQVVKNTLLTGKKSIVRKVQEIVLALKLERVYEKDQILETYLNTIPYGGTLYGIEAASQSYFGVPAKDLTIPQAAYLAAMIQAPTYYSPYGNNRDALDARKNIVLARMLELGFIDQNTFNSAVNEVVAFAPSGQNTIVAPHFVFYILEQLEKEYGTTALASGLQVTTTLDADLQVRAESIVNRYALENTEKFRATNASLVALDPKTGQILTMVGSRDFFDTAIDGQYNATVALRQPGSTMKPFVYALALMKGYTRNTVIFDVPTQFSTACEPGETTNNRPPCYAPQNYDDTFRGPMTFETALAQSINIPAVKVLYLVGVQSAVEFAKSFGLSSLGSAAQYGLTLVLGGGEVRLLDLVGAYGVFANNGVRNPSFGVLEVRDATSRVLFEHAENQSYVLPASVTHSISAMLSNEPARGYRNTSPFVFPGYDVAAKTGTTDDTRDAWVVGYTPSIAMGVWVGNNDNTPMVRSVAGFIAAPMWQETMRYALAKYPKEYFGAPEAISAAVPPVLQGNWRIPDTTGAIVPHSLLYWVHKEAPQLSQPSRPQQDGQFAYWEYAVQAWHSRFPGLFVNNPPLYAPVFGAVESAATTTDSLGI